MNIYEERDYLLDVIKQLQRDSRHLEDGLIDARRVIWDYRKIEQNATSTLDELVESLDSMEKERDEARRWARRLYRENQRLSEDYKYQTYCAEKAGKDARRLYRENQQLQYDLTRTIEERDMALGDNDERDEYEKAGKVWRRLSAHWWEMSKRFMTERDDFKVRLEGSRNMVDHVVAERNQARRRIAELETIVANPYLTQPGGLPKAHTPPGESLLSDDTVDEGRYVRRADGSFLWWSDHEREEKKHYTPGAAPIQGVDDMYYPIERQTPGWDE